jgi:glutamine amidotransferase
LIAVVDYNAGNAGSVLNMLSYLGIEAILTSDHGVIMSADKLVISGVGSFDTAVKQLADSGLREVLDTLVLSRRIPVLGICLGMQLMGLSSEEGSLPGLNWLKFNSVRFDPGAVRIPHMAWNNLKIKEGSRLFSGFEGIPRFYFAHSFYPEGVEEGFVTAKSVYGKEFTAAFEKENIAGVQFHPEKSHSFGMKLLKNFAYSF